MNNENENKPTGLFNNPGCIVIIVILGIILSIVFFIKAVLEMDSADWAGGIVFVAFVIVAIIIDKNKRK